MEIGGSLGQLWASRLQMQGLWQSPARQASFTAAECRGCFSRYPGYLDPVTLRVASPVLWASFVRGKGGKASSWLAWADFSRLTYAKIASGSKPSVIFMPPHPNLGKSQCSVSNNVVFHCHHLMIDTRYHPNHHGPWESPGMISFCQVGPRTMWRLRSSVQAQHHGPNGRPAVTHQLFWAQHLNTSCGFGRQKTSKNYV